MSDVKVSEKGTFVQSLNPMTGQREWKMVPEDYDYQQEVARAAFADMLHDTERVKNISIVISVMS
jgi:protein arginine N-methyltransferase 7